MAGIATCVITGECSHYGVAEATYAGMSKGGTPEQVLPLFEALLLEWHPDKASCTELATAVTRWLVDVREPIVQARTRFRGDAENI